MKRNKRMSASLFTQTAQPAPPPAVTVAIVEDDEGIRESLAEFLGSTQACRCVGVFADAESALAEFRTSIPEVVLMDINLPGKSGIEATREIKRTHPDARIVMLTVYEEGKPLFESLKAGACGYLLKRTAPDRIVEAIRDARAGGVPLNPQMAAKVAQYFQQSAAPKAEINSLTQRERETLELLSEGFLYKEIASRMGVRTSTVHEFIKHIYEKLHVHSRSEAIVKFLGR
jgi:DNA-binding NarL/FixJ family response regulator